jgi:hypothetical protein
MRHARRLIPVTHGKRSLPNLMLCGEELRWVASSCSCRTETFGSAGWVPRSCFLFDQPYLPTPDRRAMNLKFSISLIKN